LVGSLDFTFIKFSFLQSIKYNILTLFKALPIILLLLFVNTQPLVAQSDLSATCQTQALYQQLKNVSTDKLLFGHQNTTLEGIGWEDRSGLSDRSDCLEAVGDYPAVYGFDFVRGFIFRQHTIRAHARGAVITFSDHMENFQTGGDSWDVQGNPVQEVLTDNSLAQQRLINHLNQVANFLNTLVDENGDLIPVIYRPFHENTGNWFWWSEPHCTPEEYVALWQFTINYLRDERNIHHVLYAYSPSDPAFSGGYEARYPGNDYVDIVGFDSYATILYEMFLLANAQLVVEFAEANDKVAALTEFGVSGGVQFADRPDWFTTTFLQTLQEDEIARKLAYAHTWRNERPNHHWVPLPEEATHTDFVAFFEDEFTVFENDLPDMYDCSFIISTAVEDNPFFNKIELIISPNPSVDYIRVQLNGIADENTFDLTVFNHLGQLVMRENDYFMGNEVSVQRLPIGMYFLQLVDNKGTIEETLSFVKGS